MMDHRTTSSLRRCFVVAVLVGAVAATSCSTRELRPQVHQVVIRGMQFVPAELVVARGDIIVWTNEDYFPHTATAPGVFDSKTIETKRQWRYTAKEPGDVPYVCTLHPTMKAKLIVR
jgi:plastocyanin